LIDVCAVGWSKKLRTVLNSPNLPGFEHQPFCLVENEPGVSKLS
jgi:hypothetical protein